MTALSPTARTTLGRHRERAAGDPNVLHAVLDEALICHLGFLSPDGSPVVLPTGFGVIGETLYVHGSVAARPLRPDPEQTVCVTVTLVDAVVLARSAFHHSMNYRSAVVYGVPRVVTDPDEKEQALAAITEHLAPGQWAATRTPNRKELAATTVLALPLAEASVKVRSGPPIDEPGDVAAGGWAGVQPVLTVYGDPVTAPDVPDGVPVPAHVAARTAPEAPPGAPRVPAECTLPTAEQPLRAAEFADVLRADVLAAERVEPGRLRLTLRAEAAARVAELAVRESACCSFFDFDLTIGADGVALEVRVPDSHTAVLDGLTAGPG